MKNPYRKFDICIFCDDKADSREHILSKWIGKKLGTTENAQAIYLQQNTGNKSAKVITKASSPITSFTSKCVCSTCNNGWMSKAVSEAKPILNLLIDGVGIKSIAIDEQYALYRHFLIMAAVVDVETTQTPPILSAVSRKRYRNKGVIDHTVNVHIARFYTFEDNPFFDIATEKIFGTQTLLHKRIIFVVGRLVVTIDMGVSPRKSPGGFKNLFSNSRLKWPPLTYINEKRLQKACVLRIEKHRKAA